MRNQGYFRNKSVTVVGLARSGLSTANLLYELGARVSVTEAKDDPQTRKAARLLVSRKIKLELGTHTPGFIRGSDLVVISPGVADTALPVIWAKKSGIPVISEIEVGAVLCPANIIAVTGSSGKTTVTTLIGKVLKAAKKKVFVCGNIGNPFTGEVARINPPDWVVLEISSFQLEKILTFKPRIALITNISKNHLDRYPSMKEYIQAKKRIFLNQDRSDYLVLNKEDKELKKIIPDARQQVVVFGKDPVLNPNQSAAMAVASILAIPRAACLRVFEKFKGLEHRMEQVADIRGVKFINDSKATTVESAVWALKNISSPVFLIAGGRDKGVDYRGLLPAAKGKVKEAILIGEARKKIKSAFSGRLEVSESTSLEQAVREAFSKACPGDCVLLSPMCSSYDMFSDYEHRGRVFKKAVEALEKKQTRGDKTW
jgi:UDP-N-acetylmuramoylalanine--D-glutamate ligase